jgi:hypothetical protein
VTDIEGTAEEIGTELDPTANLFGTNNPTEVIRRATEIADALAEVIRDKHLFATIKGKNHVTIEGWQTLGAMLGVTSICEWTRPVEKGWEARAIVNTLDGRTIGAAESQCLTTEERWAKADDYAVRSMAQTRASSKALASVLRFVVILRGYHGTPAEEIENGAAAETLEDDAELGKIRKLYEELTPAQRKGLSKAKFNAQLRAASESQAEMARLWTEIKGRKDKK